jgi:hypothetical protein
MCLAEDRCTNQMCSRIGLFEETCICRGGQSPEELNLATVIDECFFVETVFENLEEIGNLQRMLCENLAVSWIERSQKIVGLGSGCNHDVCPRPMAINFSSQIARYRKRLVWS